MYMTSNFSFEELTTTSHTDLIQDLRGEALDMPVYGKLYMVASTLLQPLRDMYKKPIKVTSGYRSKALNTRIGGASKSQHMLGEAADITLYDKNKNKELFELAIRMAEEGDLKFGQMILEEPPGQSWIHISLGRPFRQSEGQVMKYDGKKYKVLRTIDYKGL